MNRSDTDGIAFRRMMERIIEGRPPLPFRPDLKPLLSPEEVVALRARSVLAEAEHAARASDIRSARYLTSWRC